MEVKSFEGKQNRLPFKALQPTSVSSYRGDLVRLVLFLQRHQQHPLYGLPAITGELATAITSLGITPTRRQITALLLAVFEPPVAPVAGARSSDVSMWFCRLLSFANATVFRPDVTSHVAVHLIYSAR